MVEIKNVSKKHIKTINRLGYVLLSPYIGMIVITKPAAKRYLGTLEFVDNVWCFFSNHVKIRDKKKHLNSLIAILCCELIDRTTKNSNIP